jgi:hypothetical protein
MDLSVTELAGAAWLSRALGVVARLGVADLIEERPLSLEELAERTGTHQEALGYLMRLLVMTEIFGQDAEGRYLNTAKSGPLRTDHPESMRYFVMLSGEMYYDAWGGLLHTVRTGESASWHVLGGSIYTYMENHPDAADAYDKGMEDLARSAANHLATEYDFGSARTLVDIGGGNGALLRRILTAHQELRGIVVDRADVTERAAKELETTEESGLASRLSFQAGDFFTELPAGGDLYLLKNVLHNWNAENSVRIISTIGQAMAATAADAGEGRPAPRLLIVEPLIEHDVDPVVRALFQMVICEPGTRSRSEADIRAQVTAAGLTVDAVTHIGTGHSLIECSLAKQGATV